MRGALLVIIVAGLDEAPQRERPGGGSELIDQRGVRALGPPVALVQQRVVSDLGVEQRGDRAQCVVGVVARAARLEAAAQLGDGRGRVAPLVPRRQREDGLRVQPVRQHLVVQQLEGLLGHGHAALGLVGAIGQAGALEPANEHEERLVRLVALLQIGQQAQPALHERLGERFVHHAPTLPASRETVKLRA